MTETFVRSLDALGAWRLTLDGRVRELGRWLREQDLADQAVADAFDALRQRLAGEKLTVAFVAEFSRGKSELINAIFFSDAGRRVMPASPGRTTMCPVELGWDPDEPPGLALLPIETRLESASLVELRAQRRSWVRQPLDLADPEALARSLTEVMHVRRVPQDQARALGFWSDERPEDNPPLGPDGLVEVPAWRHALINVPHPLLKRGLVVLDTPGLNAIGAEPELTVSLLPSAHATVFVLGADTGVTRSDLAIWREHLSAPAVSRFVVLNKIDALVDPLSTPEQVRDQITHQQAGVASTLGLDASRVFPLSARQALAARVAGDPAGLTESRLPALEQALADQLLPQRRDLLERMALEALSQVRQQVGRSVGDQRRQLADQIAELRGLRGKSGGKVELMLRRVQAESQEFEQCVTQLQALRVVHARMLKDLLVGLSSDQLRQHIEAMQAEITESLFKLGARKAFSALCDALNAMLSQARARSDEIHEMLGAGFTRLNADYGFSLAVTAPPDLARFRADLALIERNYLQYLGLGQALRLAQPRFMEQFRRMLMSRLRVVFEGISGEIELWNKTASAQVDGQLRERRRNFKRRRESLERIQAAAGELDARLQELEAQDHRLSGIEGRLATLVASVEEAATSREIAPAANSDYAHGTDIPLDDLPVPAARARSHGGGA